MKKKKKYFVNETTLWNHLIVCMTLNHIRFAAFWIACHSHNHAIDFSSNIQNNIQMRTQWTLKISISLLLFRFHFNCAAVTLPCTQKWMQMQSIYEFWTVWDATSLIKSRSVMRNMRSALAQALVRNHLPLSRDQIFFIRCFLLIRCDPQMNKKNT